MVVVVVMAAVLAVAVVDVVANSAARPHPPASRVAMRRHAPAAPRSAPRKQHRVVAVRRVRVAARAAATAVGPSALP